MKTMGRRLFGILFGMLLLGLMAGCGGGGGGSNPATSLFPSATLVSIDVTPNSTSIAIGTSQQFTATGIYTDNSKKDLTSSVTWSSSAGNVATVSNSGGSNGLVTSVAAGSASIKASSEGVSGSATLTVTAVTLVSIGVTPANPGIALGTPQQFTATGVFSDNTVQDLTTAVAWSSTAQGVATVSNTAGSNGLASSLLSGSTTITATLGGVSGSSTLTVTPATLVAIEVTPTNPGIAKGTTQQLKATGIFSDNTKQDLTASAAWSASDGTVATISGTGLASGLAAGTTTVTASFGGQSGTTTLTVTAATLVDIQVSPVNQSIALGTSQQFTAIGIYSDNSTQDLTTAVTWTSATPGVATISNGQGSTGLATSVAKGTTNVTATFGSLTSGSITLTVTDAVLVSIDVEPAYPNIPVGLQQPFTATGTFSDQTVQDLTTAVAWSSSDSTIATISNAAGSRGLVTTIAPGTVVITASLGTIQAGSTQLTVTNATLSSIQLTPPGPTVPRGLTQQFTAAGIFSDNSVFDLTTLATWSSSVRGVATISNDAGSAGLATTLTPGTSTITATLFGVSGSTTLTVSKVTLSSIAITPVNPGIAIGTTQQFTAIGTYSDRSTQDLTQFVTWISTTPAVAAISNAGYKGTATGISAGSTTIRAALGSTLSNDASLKVTNATLRTITIAPANAVIALKTSQQFTATGTFSDGTSQDLTKLVTWKSDKTGVATISNSTRSRGTATGANSGTANITAIFSGISGTTTLTVAPPNAVLQSIAIVPASLTAAVGTTQQLAAIGTYASDSITFTQDLTRQMKWSSSNNNAAVVSNGFGTRGLMTAVGKGSATISATKPSSAGVAIAPATITVQ